MALLPRTRATGWAALDRKFIFIGLAAAKLIGTYLLLLLTMLLMGRFLVSGS